MSSHAVNACGSDVSAFFKSAGTSCTTPLEIFFCDIDKLSFRKLQRREDLLLRRIRAFGQGEVLTFKLTRRLAPAQFRLHRIMAAEHNLFAHVDCQSYGPALAFASA